MAIQKITNLFTFSVNLLVGIQSQLSVFYFHELTPPLMAICQLSVVTDKATRLHRRVFFALRFCSHGRGRLIRALSYGL